MYIIFVLLRVGKETGYWALENASECRGLNVESVCHQNKVFGRPQEGMDAGTQASERTVPGFVG